MFKEISLKTGSSLLAFILLVLTAAQAFAQEPDVTSQGNAPLQGNVAPSAQTLAIDTKQCPDADPYLLEKLPCEDALFWTEKNLMFNLSKDEKDKLIDLVLQVNDAQKSATSANMNESVVKIYSTQDAIFRLLMADDPSGLLLLESLADFRQIRAETLDTVNDASAFLSELYDEEIPEALLSNCSVFVGEFISVTKVTIQAVSGSEEVTTPFLNQYIADLYEQLYYARTTGKVEITEEMEESMGKYLKFNQLVRTNKEAIIYFVKQSKEWSPGKACPAITQS